MGARFECSESCEVRNRKPYVSYDGFVRVVSLIVDTVARFEVLALLLFSLSTIVRLFALVSAETCAADATFGAVTLARAGGLLLAAFDRDDGGVYSRGGGEARLSGQQLGDHR